MLFGFEHKGGNSRTMPLCLFESEMNKSCLLPASYVLVEKVPILGYKQAEYRFWSYLCETLIRHGITSDLAAINKNVRLD